MDQLLDAAEPVQTDIPTLRSVSILVIPSWDADEQACAFSKPLELYFCSFAGWADDKLTPVMEDHWRSRYKKLLPYSSTMFAADYDVTTDDANVSRKIRALYPARLRFSLLTAALLQSTPLSASALTRFMEIGKKWDPQELFPVRNKYVQTQEKMEKLWRKA